MQPSFRRRSGFPMFGAIVALLVFAPGMASANAKPPARAAQPADAPAPLSDTQVLTVLRAVHTAEIAAAEVATQKATRDAVRAFAQRMVLEHGAANDQVAARIGAGGPEDSPVSNEFEAKAETNLKKLEALEGIDFEKAFVADQVALHEELLATIDKRLFPVAVAADVRALLQSTRNDLNAHLTLAKGLVDELAAVAAPAP
jgi:putative membrane protein